MAHRSRLWIIGAVLAPTVLIGGYLYTRGPSISPPDRVANSAMYFSTSVSNIWPVGDPSARQTLSLYGSPDAPTEVDVLAERLSSPPREILTAIGAGITSTSPDGAALSPTTTTTIGGVSYTCLNNDAIALCLWIDDATTGYVSESHPIPISGMLTITEGVHQEVRG